MSRSKDAVENEQTPAPRRRVPFLAHQVAEYVVALALIAVGFHASGGAEISLVTSGILLAVLEPRHLGAARRARLAQPTGAPRR